MKLLHSFVKIKMASVLATSSYIIRISVQSMIVTRIYSITISVQSMIVTRIYSITISVQSMIGSSSDRASLSSGMFLVISIKAVPEKRLIHQKYIIYKIIITRIIKQY